MPCENRFHTQSKCAYTCRKRNPDSRPHLRQGSSILVLFERELFGPVGGGRVLDTVEAGNKAH